MMKRIVATGFAILLGLSPALAQNKVLTTGMGTADASTLDPHKATTTADKGVLNYMFNGLVRIKPVPRQDL